MTESKTRFIAPALSLLALRGSLDRHDHLDPDGDGHVIHGSNPGAVSVGGFFGLGLIGIPLSHVAPPVGIGLSILDAAKTMYRNVLAKGREVQFPADTVMRLQLAPGPSGHDPRRPCWQRCFARRRRTSRSTVLRRAGRPARQ